MEGRDKLLVGFRGERLLERIGRQLRSRFSDLVAVSSRPEVFEGLGYRVVPDSLPDGGPLAGLHAGLRATRSEWVYLVACDMPFFSPAWVDALERRIEELPGNGDGAADAPVAVAAASGPYFEPFHAFYRAAFADDIEAAFLAGGGRRPSIQSVARSRAVELLDGGAYVSSSSPIFANVNTPRDLLDAEGASIGRDVPVI